MFKFFLLDKLLSITLTSLLDWRGLSCMTPISYPIFFSSYFFHNHVNSNIFFVFFLDSRLNFNSFMYCTFIKQFFLSTMYGLSSSLLYSSLKSRDHHFTVVNYMYHKYHNCYLNIEHVSRQICNSRCRKCIILLV